MSSEAAASYDESAVGESAIRIADVVDGMCVVSLLGEHDIATEVEVRDTLASLLGSGVDVVVDLSGTRFIDCSIWHALNDSQRHAIQHGMRVSFQLGDRAIVQRVLELTGALKAWRVYGTRSEAVNALKRAPYRDG